MAMEDVDVEKRLIEIEESLEKIELFELKKAEEEKDEKEEKVVLEEEDETKYYEMKTPTISTWINGVDGTVSKGVVVITYDNNNNNDDDDNDDDCRDRCAFYVCPICFESLTNDDGNHRICCLPCGHIYGFSCIKKWLRQPSSSTKGCPQCNKLCTVKNVKRLYASHHCAQTSRNASTTHFPFTRQGYKAFKLHVSQLRSNLLPVFEDTEKRRVLAYRRHARISDRLVQLISRMVDAQALVKTLGNRDDALGRRANLLPLRINSLYPLVRAMELRADPMLRHADALEQRVKSLVRRYRAYKANILFFKQAYKKHTSLAARKNTKQLCPKTNTDQQVLPKSEFE